MCCVNVRFPGADLGLLAGPGDSQTQSVVVIYICDSTYEPGGGGGHMCYSTYISLRVNTSRL